MRFGCGKVLFLEPILVAFVLAEFHAAGYEMQFALDVGSQPALQESSAGTDLK